MGAPARPQGLPATQKVYIDIPLNGAEARGASRLSTKNLRLQVSCHPRPPPPPCAPPQAAFSLSEPGAGFGARRPGGTLRRRRAHARSQRKSHTVALITCKGACSCACSCPCPSPSPSPCPCPCSPSPPAPAPASPQPSPQ